MVRTNLRHVEAWQVTPQPPVVPERQPAEPPPGHGRPAPPQRGGGGRPPPRPSRLPRPRTAPRRDRGGSRRGPCTGLPVPCPRARRPLTPPRPDPTLAEG